MSQLQEVFSIFPLWVYITMAVVALILGRGIRWWYDRRQEREKERLKELQKQEKIRMKRYRKQQKKR